MAKKAVASFGSGKGASKTAVKCIRMTRSDKSGAYIFKEEMVPTDLVKDHFNKK